MWKKCLILLIIFPLGLSGAIVFNDIVCVYSPTEEKQSIESNMVTGATLFLESNAKAIKLLAEYERQSQSTEISKNLALTYTKGAIGDLAAARVNYIAARDTGERIGYIDTKRALFTSFDFDNFIIEKKLDANIANRVKSYLVKMDVIGIYNENIKNVDNILSTLKQIEAVLEAGQRPNVEIMWELLQGYSEAALFGNYATIIGSTVLSQDGPPICNPD